MVKVTEVLEKTIWRHVRTGNRYIVLMNACLEADTPPFISPFVVYQRYAGHGVTTGTVWLRPLSQFTDGRFELEVGRGMGTDVGESDTLPPGTDVPGKEVAMSADTMERNKMAAEIFIRATPHRLLMTPMQAEQLAVYSLSLAGHFILARERHSHPATSPEQGQAE